MSKKILIRQISFVLLMLLFSLSCNNPETDAAKTDNPDSTGVAVPPADPSQANLFTGRLDTLWIDSLTFVDLGPGTRLTFRFYIDTPNNISLRGWTGNSNSWDSPPDVYLKTGRQSTVKFGAGSYFGNLQLSPNNYNAIKQKLQDTKSKYVVFGPVNPTTGVTAGQILYKIYVTSDTPHILSPSIVYKFMLEETGIETNPSPPKNSN